MQRVAKLFLIRHGHYLTSSGSLSLKGKKEMKKAGQLLKNEGISILFHSTKLRAMESAKIIADFIHPSPALVVHSELDPESEISAFIQGIKHIPAQSIAAVGHLPFLERLLSSLVVKDNGQLGCNLRQDLLHS